MEREPARTLTGGRRSGITRELAQQFGGYVESAGPPCLLVGLPADLGRVRPYMPAWVEWLPDNDAPPGIVYGFATTLSEWESSRR